MWEYQFVSGRILNILKLKKWDDMLEMNKKVNE